MSATGTYMTDEHEGHHYQVTLQSKDGKKIYKRFEGSDDIPNRVEGVPLMPIQQKDSRLRKKVGPHISEGDELLFILYHETMKHGDYIRVQAKPPFSEVVYLELAGEVQGEGNFQMKCMEQ